MSTLLASLHPNRWLTGLWQSPDFRKLWGSLTITHFGGQVTFLALPLTAALMRQHAHEVQRVGMLRLARENTRIECLSVGKPPRLVMRQGRIELLGGVLHVRSVQ